jgi:hypothetical protein
MGAGNLHQHRRGAGLYPEQLTARVMDDPTNLIALFAGGGAIAGITFWMNRGRAEQKIEEAVSAAHLAVAKADLVASQLADFKAEVAGSYVSTTAINKIEQRITIELHRLTDEVNRRFDEFTKTLIELAAAAPAGIKRKP